MAYWTSAAMLSTPSTRIIWYLRVSTVCGVDSCRVLAPALAELNCKVSQATSDEALGLLAYVAHHLGAHHSPDLFHVQHELSKAIAVPMAAKQRAAAKVMITA